MTAPIKNCRTCGHRFFVEQCALTGYVCYIQRRNPSPPCDINLSGWVQRPQSRLGRMADAITELFCYLVKPNKGQP